MYDEQHIKKDFGILSQFENDVCGTYVIQQLSLYYLTSITSLQTSACGALFLNAESRATLNYLWINIFI